MQDIRSVREGAAKPYEQRVDDVIKEELAVEGIDLLELPGKFSMAIQKITTRLAADMEYIYQHPKKEA